MLLCALVVKTSFMVRWLGKILNSTGPGILHPSNIIHPTSDFLSYHGHYLKTPFKSLSEASEMKKPVTITGLSIYFHTTLSMLGIQ